MLTAMVIVFLVGYLMIALEHPLKINKAGTALLIGTILWVFHPEGLSRGIQLVLGIVPLFGFFNV